MGRPIIPDVCRLAREAVLAARREGRLRRDLLDRHIVRTDMSRFYFASELTPRIVRGSVEEALSLESGTLDAKEYRAAVKETIEAAVVRVPPPSHLREPFGGVLLINYADRRRISQRTRSKGPARW